MDRLYRVRQHAEPFYAVEHNGSLRRATFTHDRIGPAYALHDTIAGGLDAVQLLAPVAPSKIICVGLNYSDHAAEQKKALPAEPLLFFKPPTAVIAPGETVRLPPGVGRVDYEAELAVVIGRRAHRVPRAKARDYVLGLTCLNDVTARDIQNRETQYTRAKGFDTFAPFGPCIAIDVADDVITRGRAVEGWVNGERRQASTTAQLIFPIDYLVEYITFVMTLEPGDIISTGTPAGVGPLHAGDTVTVKVEGVGEITNPVQNEAL